MQSDTSRSGRGHEPSMPNATEHEQKESLDALANTNPEHHEQVTAPEQKESPDALANTNPEHVATPDAVDASESDASRCDTQDPECNVPNANRKVSETNDDSSVSENGQVAAPHAVDASQSVNMQGSSRCEDQRKASSETLASSNPAVPGQREQAAPDDVDALASRRGAQGHECNVPNAAESKGKALPDTNTGPSTPEQNGQGAAPDAGDGSESKQSDTDHDISETPNAQIPASLVGQSTPRAVVEDGQQTERPIVKSASAFLSSSSDSDSESELVDEQKEEQDYDTLSLRHNDAVCRLFSSFPHLDSSSEVVKLSSIGLLSYLPAADVEAVTLRTSSQARAEDGEKLGDKIKRRFSNLFRRRGSEAPRPNPNIIRRGRSATYVEEGTELQPLSRSPSRDLAPGLVPDSSAPNSLYATPPKDVLFPILQHISLVLSSEALYLFPPAIKLNGSFHITMISHARFLMRDLKRVDLPFRTSRNEHGDEVAMRTNDVVFVFGNPVTATFCVQPILAGGRSALYDVVCEVADQQGAKFRTTRTEIDKILLLVARHPKYVSTLERELPA